MDAAVSVLGGFRVAIDGDDVPPGAWQRRSAASLVKLLALTEGRRMHREQVLDLLWPDVPPETAGPRLHKAAHYARRALGVETGVSLRNDLVLLLPDAGVRVDAVAFRQLAERALAGGSSSEAADALAHYRGPLLPEDLYEPWTQGWREAIATLHRDLLRLAGRWADLLDEDPSDEQAHLALARSYADRGDRRAARRQLERMDQALRRELGIVASPAAERLRAELADPVAPAAAPAETTRLVGRRAASEALEGRLDRAAAGRGGTVLITGVAGVGKSALLDLLATMASRRGWHVARGAASEVEGSWPYAPVLEAFGDLCRRHPALLDGLDDSYSGELAAALSGQTRSWGGETAHQRLFVAAAELLRLAAAGRGLLLVVDDVHEADEASLRLLHYLARCAVTESVVIALATRPTARVPLQQMSRSLVARGIGAQIELGPLDRTATRRLLAHKFPDVDDEAAEQIWALSGGLPFRVLEAARGAKLGASGAAVSGLDPDALSTVRRAALLGHAFTTDELLAVSEWPEDVTYEHLEAALAATVVEPTEVGYRFRHALVRDAVLATFSPAARSRTGRDVATRLAGLGGNPARVAQLFIGSGHPVSAIPYARPAVDTAGALGAYRDGLALVDAVVDHASGADRAHLLARRADLLMALADPAAVEAYRAALPITEGTEHRLVRARLARAATFQADLETARSALVGLEPEGDAADGPILLARGNLAYFSGDLTTAWEAAEAARSRLQPDDPWQFIDMVGLQGFLAHQRGEWFERFTRELRSTLSSPSLAGAVFDAHLCVAEYLLYGPTPFDEVIGLGVRLRRRAEHHGALRGVAFATALIGEAALLKGDLDRAEHELHEAIELHRDVDAPAGEAHSLQRLAEVRLARGDRAGALRLLAKALPLARWSMIGRHLLQRIYATQIACAQDSITAVALVEQAEATLGENDRCLFCDVLFAVPAAIVYADAGDPVVARDYLVRAEESGRHWEGTAWSAAIAEAKAHVAAAEDDRAEFDRWITSARILYTSAGQPLDAARCSSTVAASPTSRLSAGRSEIGSPV